MNTSFLFGLLVGCFVSVLGCYCIQKVKEQKIDAVSRANKKNNLSQLFAEYGDFFNDLKNRISESEHTNTREFFVVDKNALMSSAIPRLRFDLSEDILPILKKLEELHQIEKVSHDSLLYRMDDDFIRMIKSFENKEKTPVLLGI